MLPIKRPGKVICVGLNYRGHAEEQGVKLPDRPLLFAKWPTALTGPGDPIVLSRVHRLSPVAPTVKVGVVDAAPS